MGGLRYNKEIESSGLLCSSELLFGHKDVSIIATSKLKNYNKI